MESFLKGKVTLHRGDCLEILATLDADSIDACVCDPPYHLTSIVKRFGADNAAPAQFGTDGAYARASRGFMGKQWDGGDIAFRPELWAEVLRVLKPGAHLLAFSGTRTYHRMACAIEDAGFEIRDQIGWCYGSGFPKSHDISKAIDRLHGAERTVKTGVKPGHEKFVGRNTHPLNGGWDRPWASDAASVDRYHSTYAPATPEAERWCGWGTALKPAWEPIVLARKPLSESSIAANVLRHGTGAINIDGCRIAGTKPKLQAIDSDKRNNPILHTRSATNTGEMTTEGRWPANLIHDGSEEVVRGFPDANSAGNYDKKPKEASPFGSSDYGHHVNGSITATYADSGSAARFFYTAKADADDRLGSKHPTVKPLDLMQYLVRLVTPHGGTVIDPFAGTGTTGEAAWREGAKAVLIEREAEYQEDIVKRMGLADSGAETRRAASIKQEPVETLPMFASLGDKDA